MHVILRKDHENLGKALDIVNVKDGFARNYLIPRGIAVKATEGNKRGVAEQKKIAEKREEKKQGEARHLAKKIENVPCTIPARVGEDDRLFGSVGPQEICDFLAKEGFMVERKSVELEEPIRQLGVYPVTIRLYKDVAATLKIWVVKDQNA